MNTFRLVDAEVEDWGYELWHFRYYCERGWIEAFCAWVFDL